MISLPEVEINLNKAENFIAQAAASGAKLAVLPENFAVMGTPENVLQASESSGKGVIQNFLAQQAKQHRLWIVGGTIPLRSKTKNKVTASCLVFNDQGKRVAQYDKIHLFDASITKGVEEHKESKTIAAGKNITLVKTALGKLGLAICYDIRFPELFRRLFNKGAEIFALPAAFTVPTGEAHWESLTRARAIENQSYFIAACQTGTHVNNRKTYGHSVIIDPWGKILVSLPSGEGIISANIDLNYLKEIRKKMPIAKHQRLK